MYNLIQFILRFGSFFTFLMLEIVSVYLIINYNRSQRDIFINSANLASGKLYEQFNVLKGFVTSNQLADSLALENSTLYQEKFNSAFLFDTLDRVKDTNIIFQVIPARVINNSIGFDHNYLTINKGSAEGLTEGMAVITGSGLVGIIKKCSDNYSLIISMLNKDIKVSAKVPRNNYFGSLTWDGKDQYQMTLEDVPRHAEIIKGDTIVTSGFSLIFPKDIYIGVVDDIKFKTGTNLYALGCKTKVNFSTLQVVYILKSRPAPEITKLEADVTISK